ncbi:MAG: electron transport complex subunit RsxC [Clostridiaceae bacterium]|nr:electron transport complex subunit RsxC [Clostridiaceae bacterium]
MPQTFKGGVHPDDMKYFTNQKPIELLPPPQKVILPMSMHIGAPCQPMVSVGDHVLMGQMIASSPAAVSAPIHATVSGTVSAITALEHPSGTKMTSIVIDNDFQDELDPSVVPVDYSAMTAQEMIECIKNAGIVGHGGAAFPTHIKLLSALEKIDTVIINGAECEPYLTSDHRILLEYPWEVVSGIQIILKIFGLKNAILGIEINKTNALSGINACLPHDGSIKVVPLVTKYPQGAEKQLIKSITGREVPSGKLPADAGCAVFNIDTAASIYRLFNSGMPMLRRIVTVSGPDIALPKNLEVRIGTPIKNLIEFCGGFNEPPTKLLMGGPMMGVALYSDEVPVIKGTNGILAFSEKTPLHIDDPKCIRCGRCVSECPMQIVPTYIYQAFMAGKMDECKSYSPLDCIECGVCSYTCPAKVPLTQGIRTAKQKIMAAGRK